MAFMGGAIAAANNRRAQEERYYYEQQQKKEEERRAKMTPEARKDEDRRNYEYDTRQYRNTEYAGSKMEIILNKYMKGLVDVLPNGKLNRDDHDTYMVASINRFESHERIRAEDVAKVKERKLAPVAMIKPPTRAENLAVKSRRFNKKLDESFAAMFGTVISVGIPALAMKMVSVYAKKKMAKQPEIQDKDKDVRNAKIELRLKDVERLKEKLNETKKLDKLHNYLAKNESKAEHKEKTAEKKAPSSAETTQKIRNDVLKMAATKRLSR